MEENSEIKTQIDQNIPELDSFENITLLNESTAPLDDLAYEISQIKPCLLSAKDVLTSSSISELEHFSSLDIANKILSTLVESESKIYRSLSNTSNKVTVDRSFSFGHQPCEFSSISKPISLPSISTSKIPSSTAYFRIPLRSILKSGNSSQNPKKLINSTFKHPLEDPVSFNSSLSELAHLSIIVSRLLKIDLNYDIIPYPYQIVMSQKSIQESKASEKMIICFESNSSLKQLKENAKNVNIFLDSLTKLITEASKICQEKPIKIDFNAIDLMLNINKLSKLDISMWESTIQTLLNIGHLFIQTIEKLSCLYVDNCSDSTI